MHSGQKQPRQRQFIKQITTALGIIGVDEGMKVKKGKLKNRSIQKQSKE